MDKTDVENTSLRNTEVADKDKKSILIKQILFMSLGSVVGVLLFTDIHFSVIDAGRVSLLSTLLIPALFAYPIIARKFKLFFIPCVIFPITVSIIFPLFVSIVYLNDWGHILSFCLILIVLAVPGVVVGVLIRLIKTTMLGVELRGRNIAKVIGVIILLVMTLNMANFLLVFFGGHPVGVVFANYRIQAYVSEYFSDYDLIVSRPRYNWKAPSGGIFISNVALRKDENISFDVIYWGNGRFTNNYNRARVR